MSKDYHHLTYAQRCQISILKDRGDSFRSIAESIREMRDKEDIVTSKPKKKLLIENLFHTAKK